MNDYLWDRNGRDADIERIEDSLARYRYIERPFVLRHPMAVVTKHARLPLYMSPAIAAVLVVAIGLLIWSMMPGKAALTVVALEGAPRIDNIAVASAKLYVGSRIETGNSDRARIQLSGIGWVQIEPGSVLTLIEAGAERQRFRLERGELRAQVNAPPAVFIVETPAARAIDLGCAYRLRFIPGGESMIEVTDGWVEIDHGFEQTLVPAGAMAWFTVNRISPAYMNQTSPDFRDAMLQWWRAQDEPTRRTALARALSRATRSDAFTLLNMLRRSRPEERPAIYDRLARFIPAPPEVSRSAVLAGETNAEEAWWSVIERELGLGTIKKKGPLRVDPYWPN